MTKTHFIAAFLALLLWLPAAPGADKTIHDFTLDTAIATEDEVPFWDVSAGATKKLTLANFKTSLAITKTDVGLGSVENTALTTWAGSTALVTVGTISAGTWNAGVIGPAYLGTGASITTKFLRGDGTWQTIGGGGDALVANPLSQFASTTSAQLRGVLSDESGSGVILTANGDGSALTGLTQSQVGLGAVENTALSTWTGSTALVTVGTIASGTWHGTAIADSYVASAGTWNAKLSPSGDGSSLTGLTQSQVSGLTTTSVPQFSNVRVTQSTLTYGATPALDFSGDGFRTITLAGDATFSSSNLAAGRSVTVRIVGDGSARALAFPAWKFVGAAAPSTIAAGKTAVLTVTSFGTTDANCVAAYAVEP